MKMKSGLFALLAVLAMGTVPALGMSSTPLRLVMWHQGETIAGDDFIAANEAVVDYLATLRRPDRPLGRIIYECQGKARVATPTVQGTSTTSFVEILTVYELKDCTESAK